ncbi:PREDICTED: uncharacterized protein LOC108759612, partial [Trachymyrmex cornetzi]|uniref:uncharacterized protein LOC108759612 n=1 Tax=Trachymyrmex cornetzi TaxID=471704 RepID=UPI00084F54B0
MDFGKSNTMFLAMRSNTAPDERKCEMHFQANVSRNTEGRFIVKLPTNDDKMQQLGETHEIAKRRFLSLEKRLLLQPDVCAQYRKFMQEYIDLNHMRRTKPSVNHEIAYYMPHHSVFEETSTTTKLRVVFDASCKSTSGLSLNDSLSLQRIFWRDSPQNELGTYELLTLTYGTAPASFLAIRTIRKLAEDEMNSFPIGSKIILRDFYVDDLLTGASTFSEALEIKIQTVELLTKRGFDLVKWSSNHAALQDSQGSRKKKFSVGQHPSLERPTKRSILSRVVLIFDSLGLLGPSVVIAKIMIWKHVPSQDNPADSLSRGIMPDMLHESAMWWTSPPWLKLDENNWPSENFSASNMELSEGRSIALITETEAEQQSDIFERFSKLSRIVRVIAFCQ